VDSRSQEPETLDSPGRASAAFGLGTAATVLSVLGFLWLGWGLGVADPAAWILWILLYLAAIVLITVAIRALLLGKALTKLHSVKRDQFWTEHGTQFKLITSFEGVGCGIVVALAVHFHRQEMIAPGIALVVGVHFLPLARLLSFRIYYWVGAAIIVCATLAVLLFRAEAVTGVAGAGTGIVLWITAIYCVRRSRLFSRPTA
jgi:hypothetical protein